LEIAINEFKATKSDTIMIGDSDKDIGAANNVGIDSVLFFPPEHTHYYDLEEFKNFKPTYIVDDFKKVLDIVG
jgi:phosphoglycolate phosphatase-like HAD superfamily hydrolase